MNTARLGRIVIAAALAALALPAPAQAGRWLAGDLHAHTTYSHDSYGGPGDDNTGPEEPWTLGHSVRNQFLVADSRGLDFLAITDHNDVRSQSDPGFGAGRVLPIPGYEASLRGHAQMLGATRVYDEGDGSATAVNALAAALRGDPDNGAFQVNHPAEGSIDHPNDTDWEYGYDVVPDTVETWNISTLYQPPFPSASSNDDAIRYWEGWLDRGERVGATGGSDNHYLATTAIQGVGQPTTWVYADSRGTNAVLEGLRRGRTYVSAQPPAYGGPELQLRGDADGNGTHEAMMGDVVPAGSRLLARARRAAGATLRVYVDGGREVLAAPVLAEHRFKPPADATWVRLELTYPDAQAERRGLCDGAVGARTTYCRNHLLRAAMTSALYVEG